MRKILFGIICTLLIILIYQRFQSHAAEKKVLAESSVLIREQLRNTGKLLVTEGHFTEVYRYKDARELFGNLVSAEKKALVVVNAEVQVLYDLSLLEVEVDSINRVLRITAIPKAELKIFPDFEYYDVTADYLNPFAAEDYNLIKENVKVSLRKKIKVSNLQKNARNRLLSELSKFYVLTRSRGWTLEYRGNTIQNEEKWQQLLP
jgi:hypothetical protein